MAYSGNYTADDLDDIAVDGVGNAGVVFIGFLSLMVIAGVLLYLKKGWNKVRK